MSASSVSLIATLMIEVLDLQFVVASMVNLLILLLAPVRYGFIFVSKPQLMAIVGGEKRNPSLVRYTYTFRDHALINGMIYHRMQGVLHSIFCSRLLLRLRGAYQSVTTEGLRSIKMQFASARLVNQGIHLDTVNGNEYNHGNSFFLP